MKKANYYIATIFPGCSKPHKKMQKQAFFQKKKEPCNENDTPASYL
jgi:hypothetical protein